MSIKFYKFSAFVGLLIFLSACQKEFLPEDGGTGGIPPVTTSSYVLSGAPSACTSPIIGGIFKVGTPMDVSNELTVDVDVTTIGTFNINTGTVNGISFAVSGSFIAPGQQKLILTATGTPLVSDTFNFTLGNGGCSFPIIFLPGTPIPTSDCKACSYIPMCVGSKYTYSDSLYGNASSSVKDVLASSDTMIDGKVYQKITMTTGISYHNCTNGETNLIGYQVTSNNGNTVEKIQSTFLKSNASVGTTWTDKMSNALGQDVLQKYTITSKGITRTVGSFNFPDVIVVHLETGIDVPPPVGFYAAVVSDYYYAKGVGLIEVISSDPNTGEQFLHSVIKSYFVP